MDKKTYKISDLYFASFLKTTGFELVSVERSEDGKKKYFVFDNTNGLVRQIQTDYVNNKYQVLAKDLIDNIRALKALTNME